MRERAAGKKGGISSWYNNTLARHAERQFAAARSAVGSHLDWFVPRLSRKLVDNEIQEYALLAGVSEQVLLGILGLWPLLHVL